MIFDPIDNSGGNVTMLPTASKPRPDAELEVVHSYKCQHGKFLVDEKKDRVECGLCHEMLNPMWVLLQIAREDSRLRDRWSYMKAEVMLLEPKLRTKCQHCQKMTPIPSNVRTDHIHDLAAKIRRGEA